MNIIFGIKFFKDKNPVKEIDISHALNGNGFSMVVELQNESKIGVNVNNKENQQQYAFASLYKEKISMGKLPVAGKISMLKDVYLEDIIITASSDDSTNIPFETDDIQLIKKGVHFLSTLSLPGQKIPLEAGLLTDDEKPKENLAVQKAKEENFKININKALGPFLLKAIYIYYGKNEILLGLDAVLKLSGLNFEMDGLCIYYNTSTKKISFDIKGLMIDVKMSGIEIGGGLLRDENNEYSGSLVVRLTKFEIMAFGSYKPADSSCPVDSVFAFALLKAPIGGPPCFFVTGLAFGFGYNRCLSIPAIDSLEDFPLLKAVKGFLSTDDINKYFAPKEGENWIAAGILFNSFKMIDSFALLTASWGSELEINLLGRSTLNVPFNVQTAPIAHAVLLLKASFKPSSSMVAVDAILSSESFIFSKDCHLTGSFAFYAWFGGEHAGDFVLTLGGYRLGYKKPAHYPSATRLGFKWQVTGQLTAQGSLYFALTPSCIMAGGQLSLNFSAKNVKAWLDANVDILINWKPYSYDFKIGVRIGVNVNLKLFKVKLEIGCDLHVWGPEFSGIAHVHLWVISFSIPFGNGKSSISKAISPEEFITSFLPNNKSNETSNYKGGSINLINGLIKETKDNNGNIISRTVCGDTLEFVTKSAVPSINLYFNDNSIERPSNAIKEITLRPCGESLKKSTHVVNLYRHDKQEVKINFVVTPIAENVPSALWAGKSEAGETVYALTGLTFKIKPSSYKMRNFSFIGQEWSDSMNTQKIPKLPQEKYKQSDAYKLIKDIGSEKISDERRKLLECLDGAFLDVIIIELNKPETIFSAMPGLASIGDNIWNQKKRA